MTRKIYDLWHNPNMHNDADKSYSFKNGMNISNKNM